jgi:lysophospholipase L1-like esterase
VIAGDATRRAVVALAGALVALSACSGGGTPTASSSSSTPPVPIRWIAAGDSYAAGVGAPRSRGECGTSDQAMAPLARGLLVDEVTIDEFTHVACSGAVLDDILPQVRAADASAGGAPFNLVTLTAGGNDVGFARILKDCFGLDDVLGRSPQPGPRGCDISEEQLNERVDALPGRLVALYEAILDQLAPGGVLVVVGYPRLHADPSRWPDDTCGGLSKPDGRTLRSVAESVDRVIAAAAEEAGATYVSMLDAFEGHELCGPDDRWLNGIAAGLTSGNRRLEGAFHPNDLGEREEASLVADVLRGLYDLG